MKKNIDIGMIIVLSMSAASASETVSAEADLNNDFDILNNISENKNDIENNNKIENNDEIGNFARSESDDKIVEKKEKANVKIKTIEESKKINSGRIITEKVFDNNSDSTVSSSAVEYGSVDFKLKFKNPVSKEDLSFENYTDVTDIVYNDAGTSASSIEVTPRKIPFVGFDVSKGDIVIKKSDSSQKGFIVEQNGMDISIFDGKKIMLFGTTNQYGIEVEGNIVSEIILNGLSVSSEKGFNIAYGSEVNFKLIDDSLNTVKNFHNKGSVNVYGETGALTVKEFNGKTGIFGGVVKATEKCGEISDIVVKGGSVNIKTDKAVKYSEYNGEALYCNIIKVDGINSSETVEVNMNGDAFISKTDIGGNLYLFLPNRDNNVVIKSKNTAFIAYVKENGGRKYLAKEISEINRVDVEVSQIFKENKKVDATFKIKIPDSMKYSDDFKMGIQCFESGWLLDEKIDESDIAEIFNDENGEYYVASSKGLESGKTYKCRVFSICGDNVNFSDVMEFKTKSEDENKAENSFDELKISGLVKTYNSEEQNIDISSSVDCEVIYYQNGKKLDNAPINAGKYVAKVIVDDNEHEYFEKNFEFVIEQYHPVVSELPFATNVVLGTEISASHFFGGKIEGLNGDIQGSFKWKNQNEIIEESKSYVAEFVPSDRNYSNVEFEVFVEADNEKNINFIIDLQDEVDIEKGKLLILKTEAIANDGSSVIYQWYKNGKTIDGAVSSILVIDNVSDDDRGSYFVVARSLNGYFVESNNCYVDIVEDNKNVELIPKKSAKRNNKSVYAFKEIDKETETETETEINTSTSNSDDFKKVSQNKSDDDYDEEKKRFLDKILGGSEMINDEEIETDETEGIEESFSFEFETETETESEEETESATESEIQSESGETDETEEFEEVSEDELENLGLIKRVTDDLLIEIYGKVSYPDNDTVSATSYYSGPAINGEKIVYQLDEDGCFIEVDSFKFNGNEFSVLTDRDFPLIVGGEKNYSDVKYHWAEEDIKFISAFNIMSGQGGGFNPNGNVTRGDFIEALYNLAGKPEYTVKKNYFDILESGRYYDAVNWAYELGLINGRSENEFGVNLNVTREQAAVVISKYIQKMGFDLSSRGNIYSDSSNISSWAIEAVNMVSAGGIMSDLGYGRFEPKAFCSRAETATLLKKIIQYKIIF